jgi:DNA-binding transcriptional ArsR family regulator
MLHHMARYEWHQLSRTFAALMDPTRRLIPAQPARGGASISELADPLTIKLPAVMKHLDMLMTPA